MSRKRWRCWCSAVGSGRKGKWQGEKWQEAGAGKAKQGQFNFSKVLNFREVFKSRNTINNQ